jgi:transposase
MSDLFWLSEAQLRRIRPFFPLSHGIPRVDDGRVISGIIFVIRTLMRIDAFLVRWARRKFRRLRGKPRGARDWLLRVIRTSPGLFAHWKLLYGSGRTLGAV